MTSNTAPNIVIGIAGPSCSGKSTLEANLKNELGDEVTTFPFDDLFVGANAIASTPHIDREGPEVYRWDDYFNHINSLRRGIGISLIANSKESSMAGIRERLIVPRPIIVAAGFLALHDEKVNNLYDAKIFIELDDEEIVRRRQARALPNDPLDSIEYIESAVLPGTSKYVRPQKDIADYIIDGSAEQSILTAQVIKIITETQSRKQCE